MPSSYTVSLRFELQFTGENINLWGDKLNTAISKVDASIAGWLTKALTGNYTLSTANGAADEASMAILQFTGVGPFTVTIPSVSKTYDVWNSCTQPLTVTTGAGDTVTVKPGEVVRVICNGSNVERSQGTDFGGSKLTTVADPTNPQDVATKAYADALAFTANAGILPGQVGSAGQFLTTNGTNALWQQLTSANLSDTAARDAAALGRAVAMAVAL